MQTPQTNQTIKEFTPKTKILIFVKSGLLQYHTTNKGSRPEIQDDPGERGERRKSRQSSTPPTRDSAPCRRRTSVEKLSAERRHHQKTKRSVSRGRTTIQSDDQGKHFHWNCEDTGQVD